MVNNSRQPLSGRAITDDLKNRILGEYANREKFTQREVDLLKASLGATIVAHMPEKIVKAITLQKDISLNDLDPASAAAGLFRTGEMGFFIENVVFGGGLKDRTKPWADLSFEQMEKETRQFLANASAQVANSGLSAKEKSELSKTFRTYSQKEIDTFFEKLQRTGREPGTELKTYENRYNELRVGQFTIEELNPSDEKIIMGAIAKLYEKMNTLFIMSVSKTGQTSKGTKKLRVLGANLFHELMIDKVIVGITTGLVGIEVTKDVETHPNMITEGYLVTFDWTKLDSFLQGIGDTIIRNNAAFMNAMGQNTQGLKVGATQLYNYNEVLYPATNQSDFFGDVLSILRSQGAPVYYPGRRKR